MLLPGAGLSQVVLAFGDKDAGLLHVIPMRRGPHSWPCCTQAVALECMRGAHKQGRPCYLVAFSGPQQCQVGHRSVEPEHCSPSTEVAPSC